MLEFLSFPIIVIGLLLLYLLSAIHIIPEKLNALLGHRGVNG